MTKKKPDMSAILNGPILEARLIAADQLAQVAVGPFISKLVFGIDRKVGEVPDPVIAITMPTTALLAMAQQIISLLSQPEVQSTMRADMEKHLANLAGLPPTS